jgi:tetratricopeptide (TPR) repeat protein
VRTGSDFRWLALAIVLAIGRASAQPSSSTATATAEFDKGRALYRDGKYPEACTAFEQSLKLDPALGTLYNLAGCYVKIGKLASAWAAYRELAQRDTNVARRDDSAKQAGALKSRLPRLVIAMSERPAGLVVTLDGVDVTGLLGTDNPVDLGAHEIVAKAPAHNLRRVTTTVSDEAKTTTVSIELTAMPAPPPRKQVEPTPEPPAPRSNRGTYAVVATLSGVALVGTGLYFGAHARSKWDDAKALCGADLGCDDADRLRGDQLLHDARLRAGVSTGLVAGGVVALGTGITLWLTSRGQQPRRVTVGAGPSTLGLSLGGHF